MDAAARAVRRALWSRRSWVLSSETARRATRGRVRCWPHGCHWRTVRSSDAVEALGQHVDQEAPDELVGRQRHRFVPARPLDLIVLVLEGDSCREEEWVRRL